MKQFNNFILNLDNLKHNAITIKNSLNIGAKLCAMVKANAYSHGVQYVCKALHNIADFFGVATVQEAKEIREFDKTTPVLVVGVSSVAGWKWCANNDVSVTVASFQEAHALSKLAFKTPLKVHIKINTGLNRIGFCNKHEFNEAYNLLVNNKSIIIEGVFTHFATKGNDENFIIEQHDKFINYLSDVNSENLCIHCCNSYACTNLPSFHHNMVRAGFALYGWLGYGLKPVLTIESAILSIHGVNEGETIGYDRTYKAPKNMVIGVVSMGYADGFDRRNSNRAHVLVNGKRAKVVGLVCMDVFMIDLTHIKNVKVGDKVTILGVNGKHKITPQYYAKIYKTSPYEVLLKYNFRRMNVITVENS